MQCIIGGGPYRATTPCCSAFCRYTTVVSQCGSHQQLRKALELVAEMRGRGIALNCHAFSALMNGAPLFLPGANFPDVSPQHLSKQPGSLFSEPLSSPNREQSNCCLRLRKAAYLALKRGHRDGFAADGASWTASPSRPFDVALTVVCGSA